jgi:hypothetical protein
MEVKLGGENHFVRKSGALNIKINIKRQPYIRVLVALKAKARDTLVDLAHGIST